MVALCEGVSALGVEAEIVSIRTRLNPAEPKHPEFKELYQIESPLRHTELSFESFPETGPGWAGRIVRLVLYSRFAIALGLRDRRVSDTYRIVCARNFAILWMLSLLKKVFRLPWVVLADVHGPTKGRFQRFVHRQVDGNVCISKFLAKHLQRECSLEDTRVCVAHSGVKPSRFQSQESKSEAASRLGLPQDRPIVCYTGKVYYRYEEVAYLLEAAAELRDEVHWVIVGGRPDQIPPWQKECSAKGINNVVFTGFRPPSEIPAYLKAADLLVLYYSRSPLNDYRSPGKLFEYLASGTPLVAGRFEGVAEVVRDGINGYLVDPYEPKLLAHKVRALLSHREGSAAVGNRAIETATHYTWKDRAAAFLQYAERLRAASLGPRNSN